MCASVARRWKLRALRARTRLPTCTAVTLRAHDMRLGSTLVAIIETSSKAEARKDIGVMLQTAKDRRRWVRHKFYAPVRISCEQANHSSIIEGRCLMLSEGGMSLFVAANVPVGTRVKIDFITAASDHGISVEGTIRNRMVYLYGVEY